jgi:hypothetical protein
MGIKPLLDKLVALMETDLNVSQHVLCMLIPLESTYTWTIQSYFQIVDPGSPYRKKNEAV